MQNLHDEPEFCPMGKYQIPVFILFLFSRISILSAGSEDNIRFDHLTTLNGLSHNTVYCITQDSLGFMWFGTKDGLNRYDGKTFKIFQHDPSDSNSLSHNLINTIFVDSQDKLWISTDDGLNLYDREHEHFHRFYNQQTPYPKEANMVNAFYEDHLGNLWLGTSYGLQLFDQKNKSYDIFLSGTPEMEVITAICEGDNHTMIVGTYDRGLYRFDPVAKSFTFLRYKDSGGQFERWRTIYSLCRDQSGKIWITSPGRFPGKFEESTGIIHYELKNLSHLLGYYNKLYEDKSGNLWLGTVNKSLVKFNPRNVQYRIFEHSDADLNSFAGSTILSIFEDSIGNIWIGTRENGINKISKWKKKIKYYLHESGNKNSLAEGEVITLYEDQTGEIWIGHLGGTISRLNLSNNSFKHLYSTGSISSIFKDHSNTIWITPGTRSLWRYNRKSDSFAKFNHDPNNPASKGTGWVLAIAEDQEGMLWLGTTDTGLEKFDPQTGAFCHFRNNPADSSSLSNNIPLSIFQDRKGILWIGTYNGLNRFQKESGNFIKFNHDPANENSLLGNEVFALFEDRSGRFWVGTNNGLNLFDREYEIFSAFPEKVALYGNCIYHIIEDDCANLWLSSRRGLIRFNPDHESIRLFNENDGFKYCRTIDQGHATLIKNREGKILYGAGNSLAIFHPDSLLDNPNPPPVVLTGFLLFNKEVEITKDSPLLQSIIESRNIKLSYSQNNFTFSFAALDYTSPYQNQYAYKLEGVTNDWIYCSNQNIATFTNIDPGEYIFRVKGSNNDGIWNETGTSVRVIITPPFWQTGWFRIFILLIIASLLYIIYRYRINRLLELERLRIQIASDLHDDIGADLTKIALYSEIIQTSRRRDKILTSSQKIGSSSREIITTLSDIVWSIDARNDTVGDLVDRMRDFVDMAFQPGTVHLDFQTHGLAFQKKLKQTVRHNIYLIFKEAVHNAARHSGASEVRVQLTNREGKFRMEISDNGTGIDRSHKPSGHHGLENMTLRAGKIGGELKIENDQGTWITLTLGAL